MQVKNLQVGEKKVSMISSLIGKEMRWLILALKPLKNKCTISGLLVGIPLHLVRVRSPLREMRGGCRDPGDSRGDQSLSHRSMSQPLGRPLLT